MWLVEGAAANERLGSSIPCLRLFNQTGHSRLDTTLRACKSLSDADPVNANLMAGIGASCASRKPGSSPS